MLVVVRDGEVTGVRGDRDHPFTRGSLCAKVNDYQRHIYHPDRVLHPLRRVGKKGEPRFARISWDEAIHEVCGRLHDIAAEFGSEAILPYSYAGNMGLLNGIMVGDPFMHRLGATVTERTTCVSCRSTAYVATLGPAYIDPESIEHSRYILIWGANVLTSNQHLWPFIRKARRNGAKVVVIDPYRTRTAAQADWYIPIRPGTDGALALGLMNVIISKNLTDEEYIDRYTTGYEQLRERAAQFPPERVAELTGVPAADIERLACEFATTPPAIIRTGIAVERSAQGGQAYRAIFSLPALVGAWRRVGGGILEMPLWAFPVKWDSLSQPAWVRPGTRALNMLQLGRDLNDQTLDPPIKALFVYNANPAVAAPEQRQVLRGLARDDLFTVVSELFVTDTAQYADVIFPATSALEHFDLTWSYGHLYLNINLPAIEPVGESVSNTELFRRLAKGMGFADPWFQLSDEELALEVIDWSAPALAGTTLETLKRDGWARLTVPPADAFAPYATGGFPTPSGRVEFRSSMLESDGDCVLAVFREGYTGNWTHQNFDPIPNYVPPPASSFPLQMITPKSHAYLNSQYANQARQNAIEGPQKVLLNTLDADQRRISSGDRVRVHNELGSFTGVAVVGNDVMQGVVVCPHGNWREQTGAGLTVNTTVAGDFTDLGRGPLLSDARVDVEALLRLEDDETASETASQDIDEALSALL